MREFSFTVTAITGECSFFVAVVTTYIPTSPNAVPALGPFWRVQVGHSCRAPKRQTSRMPFS